LGLKLASECRELTHAALRISQLLDERVAEPSLLGGSGEWLLGEPMDLAQGQPKCLGAPYEADSLERVLVVQTVARVAPT